MSSLRIRRRINAQLAREAELDAALARRRAERGHRSTSAKAGAEARRSKLLHDPLFKEMVRF